MRLFMETGSFVVLSLPYLAVSVGFDGTVFHGGFALRNFTAAVLLPNAIVHISFGL